MYQAPSRWDEALDLGLPVFISSGCGPWHNLLESLRLSGLSDRVPARLVEDCGRVTPLADVAEPPEGDDWALVLHWSHPQEGWRRRLPLGGRRYVVTRDSKKAKDMVTRLEALGARAVPLPTISFTEPNDSAILDAAIDSLESFHWLIFTSPNGVTSFFERLSRSQRDHRSLAGAQFACIGPSTAKALKTAGFSCDLLPERYVAEGLLEALESRLGDNLEGLKILIPRAQEAREILPETLATHGAQVIVAPAYKTVPPATGEGWAVHPEARVLFTSSSTVKNWVSLTGNTTQPCFCIGPATAQTAKELGLPILGVAPVHTIDGLLDEVTKVDGTGDNSH